MVLDKGQLNHMILTVNNFILFIFIKFQVTQTGEMICDLTDKTVKQPYELIIFGSCINSTIIIPDKKLLISVPSAIHSHKPPLTGINALRLTFNFYLIY